MPAQTVIKLRRDTAANWASTNPVLATGEPGLETDSGLVKYGNGTSAWADLHYAPTSTIKTRVHNATGSQINKGSVVYVNGANGDTPTVTLSDADTEATSSKTLGIVEANIANGAQGYVIESGLITNLNTAAATAGQSVWLSSTAGGFVFGAPPAKPAHSVYLGVVTRANSNNGTILVKVQNGYELNELHDVDAGSPTTGDVLQWNGTAWVNATPPVGPQGEPGPPGQNGVNGSDGVNGTDGADGVDGADGADGADGQSVTYRGEYSSSTTYAIGDIAMVPGGAGGGIVYPNYTYISLVNNNLNQSVFDTAYWAQLVKDGDQGANGSTGPAGPAGEANFNSFLLMGA